MRWLLPFLLSLSGLAIPLNISAGSEPRVVPKVLCEHPRTLHLHRFEDRSAHLQCGGRVIVRVSVPG
ncbi:MAG TPA: hypothetical protein VGW80_00465 [Solirubrobacterales bacterium]|jgi:hypothetical protein|nr:hypothetical protein [Solirubrobacterales bacterium]